MLKIGNRQVHVSMMLQKLIICAFTYNMLMGYTFKLLNVIVQF